MKAKIFVGLLVLLSLTACEKPQPTPKEPIKAAPLSVIYTYTNNNPTMEIVRKKTDVYVFHTTASIDFDTVIDKRMSMFRRMFYTASEHYITHSPYDTIHNIRLSKGEYQIVIDHSTASTSPRPWDTVQERDTLRWYHLHNVSVSDTAGFVIVDTFLHREWSLYSE